MQQILTEQVETDHPLAFFFPKRFSNQKLGLKEVHQLT